VLILPIPGQVESLPEAVNIFEVLFAPHFQVTILLRTISHDLRLIFGATLVVPVCLIHIHYLLGANELPVCLQLLAHI
jgi:hypothetical protein